ncbi:MAG: response regulator [Pirellulales bacterium]|nr:response regulator [Pirellulales bacterium]
MPVSNETIGRPMEILLVEDDLEDAGLTMEALNKEKFQCRVSLVRDGEEAMEFVRRQGRYARAPRPDIILLDINLPKLDGREVLALLKKDDSLTRIPVVVLTASHEHQEILKSENLHVESFLTKPVDLKAFISVVRSLRKFLLKDVILPQ